MVNRELHSREDYVLLALERMRILDVAHYWAPSTHTKYQDKLRFLHKFQDQFPGLTILQKDVLKRPPSGVDIAIMWAEEAYSLRPGKDDTTVKFGTIRSLRSAFSQFEAIRAIHSGLPTRLDQQKRLLFQNCRSNDQAPLTFFTSGLASRIGTESKPSIALLMRHVIAIDAYCLKRFRQARSPEHRRLWGALGLLNTLLWLGWLRSNETFNLKWCDTTVILPRDGPLVDLPSNVGACFFGLGPSTKATRSKNAQVLIAYESVSGLSCGRWLQRAYQAADGDVMKNDTRYIFSHSSGTKWNSKYYRRTFLYPMLERLRRQGDPMLKAFDDTPGNTIPEKFWSLHSYRRGAKTHATKNGKRDSRKATTDQVYEHGRWRRRRSAEAIDKQYDEWTNQDRIQITLFCH
jgi:hypothetical protein